jgi:methionine--tRNA ligase beta chain
MISFEDFKKVELKIARVIKAENVKDSDKLIRMELDDGTGKSRQIVAGIAQFYKPEELVEKQIVIVANLEPRTLFGLESQGMLLAVESSGNLSLLIPDKEVQAGSTAA